MNSEDPNKPLQPTDADLESLLLIRRFEEKLLELFTEGQLNGTTHTCVGQEHVPVALMPLLRKDHDFVFSNHRGHGHYLAYFGEPGSLLAEIMGRDGAVCKGVGGSQHIKRGRYFSTGVQGESMPVGAGAALACKKSGDGSIAVCFIGDGTWGEGAVYEALNISSLWKLPQVVAVENNRIAQTTPAELNMAGNIEGRAAAFGVRYARFDSCDISAVREKVAPLIQATRDGAGPLVLEFLVARLGPHSKGDDTRSPKFLEKLWKEDWEQRFMEMDGKRFREVDDRIRKQIDALTEDCLRRPLATSEVT